MADLWSVSVAFRSGTNTMRLLFNSGDSAKQAYELLKRPVQSAQDFERGLPAPAYDSAVEVQDGFGITAVIDRDSVMMHWLTCMGDQLEGLKEEQLLNAHAQANLQRKVAADPLLRTAPAGQPAFKLNG